MPALFLGLSFTGTTSAQDRSFDELRSRVAAGDAPEPFTVPPPPFADFS